MYYYHMFWFILLTLLLSLIFLKRIRETKELQEKKKQIFYGSILVLWGILIFTFLYIYRTKYKTTYFLIPYEKYFIALLFVFSFVNIFSLTMFTTKNTNTLTLIYFYTYLCISVVFLFLCWCILLLPKNFSKSLQRDTEYDFFLQDVMLPFNKIYRVKL